MRVEGTVASWERNSKKKKKQLSKATGRHTIEPVKEKGSGGSLGKTDKTAQVNKKTTGAGTGDFHPESVVNSQWRNVPKRCRCIARGECHGEVADSNQLYHVCSVAKDCGQWQTHSTVGHAHQVGMGQSRHHGRLSSVFGVGSDAGIRAVRGWNRTKEFRSSHNVHRFVLKAFKEVQSDSNMELNVLRVSSLIVTHAVWVLCAPEKSGI